MQKGDNKMKCKKCSSITKKILVSVEGADKKAVSYQCPRCEYFEFEGNSAKEVIKELTTKESPLKITQRITKLSQGRLGMYFNKNVVESLNLKAGEEIKVSVPDKKHIVLKLNP